MQSRMLFSAAAAMLVTSAASATSVLYRVDFDVGTNDMAGALATLGYTVTTTDSDLSGFTLSDFDIVVYANQGNTIPGGDVTTLESYIADGGRLIFTDWRTGNPSNLGGDIGAGFNQTSLTVGSLFDSGIANPITLSNPGWGIFSTDLVATTAMVAGTWGNGAAAILVGNGGRTIWNGFLFDTGVGEQLFINQLTYLVDGGNGGIGVIPEPASWALMIGGFGLVGFALRRRRETVLA
jgi:hypothetical protein